MSSIQSGNKKDGTQPSSIRLPRALDAALRRETSRRGVSRSKLIEAAIERELFGSPGTDSLNHRILTSLLFLEELLVDTSTQPQEKLKEVFALKQKQAAELLASSMNQRRGE
jgi:hypothetical protein